MSNDKLPDGWKRVKFKEIAASITERVDDPARSGVERYVGLEHLDPDSTTIRRWGSPNDVEATKLRFYPGDVIYGRRRAYQRKLGVADFDGICSAHALVLRAKPDICLPEFLPYFLQSDSFHQRALDISVGSLSPTINWKTLAVQEFALPPAEEQQQIVDTLDSCGNWQDRLLSTLRSTADVRSAMLNELDNASSRRCRLGDLVELERGVSYKSSDYVGEGEGRPFLNLKCVSRRGTFSNRGVKWVRPDFATANVASAGELFFANTDLTPGRLLVGAPFFFRGLQHDAEPCFSMDLTRVRLLRSDLPLEIVYHLLNIPRVRSQMRALTGGSTVGHLRLGSVPDIQVPIVTEPEYVLVKLRSLEAVEGALEVLLSGSRDIARSLRERLLAGGEHVQ